MNMIFEIFKTILHSNKIPTRSGLLHSKDTNEFANLIAKLWKIRYQIIILQITFFEYYVNQQ